MEKVSAFSLACAAAALLSGCATTTSSPSKYTNQLNHYSKVQVGMPQAEVLEVMGSAPLKAETLQYGKDGLFVEWEYCATHEATRTNEYVWLVFKDKKLSSTDSMLSPAGPDGRIHDCAVIVKRDDSNAAAASQTDGAEAKARAEARAKARVEAQAKAARKAERQRRTAAAASAMNAFTEGFNRGTQAQSGSQAAPQSGETSSTPLLLKADNEARTFLGCLNCNKYDSNSVFNTYGPHGSAYSAVSIRNRYSEFGSRYSNLSACNPYASQAPFIFDNGGNYYGRFTANKYADGASNSDYIRRLVALLCKD
jgi:outer membrane protein assembly factor BamE (lipoprotein component of BamABCDE complex)